MGLRTPLPAAGDAGGNSPQNAGLPLSGRLGLQESALLPAWSLLKIAGIHGPSSGSLYSQATPQIFCGAPSGEASI